MLAEEARLDGVWLSEDLYFRGAFATAGAVAATTSRLPIGFGVIAPQTRHPAALAMEMRSLVDIAGPRITLGIGAGVAERTRLLGIPATPPLSTVLESVTAAKTLLAGERLDQRGVLYASAGLTMDGEAPSVVPPVYVAAVGPKALAQAGRCMDGVILTMMCSRRHAAWATRHVQQAAAEAGRRHPVPVVAYLPMALDDDATVARRRMKRLLGYYIARWAKVTFLSKLFTEWSDLDDDALRAMAGALDARVPAEDLVPDNLVDEYTVAGTERQCRASLEAFAAAGVSIAAVDVGSDVSRVGPAVEMLSRVASRS